jgi:hypothetical protein
LFRRNADQVPGFASPDIHSSIKVSDLCPKGGHHERLGNDLHARVEVAVADDRILGIAGNEEDLQIRSWLSRGIGPTSVTSKSILASPCRIFKAPGPSAASTAA